ncbi:nitrite extrusion protein 2 [Escherichia coli H591]|nr:nitrite extrusion protein 2 [Escherichia coli H591]
MRFSGPKTSIICSPMTSLKTSIKTITYLSDIGCLEIQGASLQVTSFISKTCARSNIIIPPSSLKINISSGERCF